MGVTGRWIAFCLVMTLAVAVMIFNKLTVCSWMRSKNPAATISILGGCLGAVACGLSPALLLNKLWWAPAALDIVGAPYVLILAAMGIWRIVRAEEYS